MPIQVSVISMTVRYGGLDMLYYSMRQQTMPRSDFEVVLVDGLYEERKAATAMLQNDFNFVHVPVPESEVYNNSSGWNAGLRAASGELVAFLVDFCWVYPLWLEDHWEFYRKNKGHTISGYLDRYPYPAMKPQPEIQSDGLWSIFKREFDAEFAVGYFHMVEPSYRERKGYKAGESIESVGQEMPGLLVYMLNDSIPMSVLRDIGGWDQAYDGAYGGNDLDLACRANIAGHKFVLNPHSIIQKLGEKSTAHLLPGKPKQMIRSAEDNYRTFQERIAAIREGKEPVGVPQGRGAWG